MLLELWTTHHYLKYLKQTVCKSSKKVQHGCLSKLHNGCLKDAFTTKRYDEFGMS